MNISCVECEQYAGLCSATLPFMLCHCNPRATLPPPSRASHFSTIFPHFSHFPPFSHHFSPFFHHFSIFPIFPCIPVGLVTTGAGDVGALWYGCLKELRRKGYVAVPKLGRRKERTICTTPSTPQGTRGRAKPTGTNSCDV